MYAFECKKYYKLFDVMHWLNQELALQNNINV